MKTTAALMLLLLLGCIPSITIKPTDHLEQGTTKTINAEVTAACGFDAVTASYRRAGAPAWSPSGGPSRSADLFSSDVPGSSAFAEGETYDFRWDVQYSSRRPSFLSSCTGVPPTTTSSEGSFTVPSCVPTPSVLGVNLLPQRTNQWCWAASGEMAMAFLGNDVAQCTQADDRLGRTDCCSNGGGTCGGLIQLIAYLLGQSACIQPGWPDFNHYGFDSTDQFGALSWDQLRRQLSTAPYCRGTPVPFTWDWDGGGAHMMVAHGYAEAIDVPFVYLEGSFVFIRDPWEPCTGDSRIITYAEFVSRAGHHTHSRDYFNVRRRP